MSTEVGRFPFYVVRRGRVPGVYRIWKECDKQVNGYRNSERRGFRDLDEALAWLRSAAAPSTRQPANVVQPVSKRPCRLLEGAFCSLLSSQQGCLGVVTANSEHCVAGEMKSRDGDVLFGFKVVLPQNGRGLDLFAHGPFCYEERFTRQEVSFAMVEKILSATGYNVSDYNYRILGRVTEQLNDAKKEEVDRLNERIRVLEVENEDLRGQVEMFGEMLEE
ncbi:hypothetical protein Ahy_A10g049668 [Arachis hypogaea]|uniref:Ribonuclease H1 N-terminal domain-containing protein n=1 Tax=Arachis hypogaea TaxID=3818 RepID=A0A445B7M3_ARAHY|nr:hypothetical protein Ahy_A10g049668 [Arachis hypogaea]